MNTIKPGTPLPWKTGEDSIAWDPTSIIADGHRLIANAGGHQDGQAGTRDANIANAAYIVTACNAFPALVEALEKLAEASRNACDARQHPVLTEALFEADAALSQAKGETS